MTYHLVFDTEAEAGAALAIVNREKGFSDPRTLTSTWAEPRQRATDGKWVFEAPEPEIVAKITVPHSIEAMQDDWFPVVDSMTAAS
jgi:hypothetical protein